MIIVTGMPRSGTSAAMQTLHMLRWPCFGVTFPQVRPKEWQPAGKPFWEFSQTLNGDLSFLAGTDMAVKVMLSKLIQYVTLDPVHDKVVLCKRDPALIAEMMMDVGIGSTTEARTMKNITDSYSAFYKWIKEIPFFEWVLDDVKVAKNAQIDALKAFLGSTEDIANAVENII